MVHAYLMYGFPTQTDQETIDSLEMVRQMFAAGILQSAYWHEFTMTAHSPVGLSPEKFGVSKQTNVTGSFANNDIEHLDPGGANHPQYAFGLKKSLLNFMHSKCLDYPLNKWFDFKVPKTTVAPDYITKALEEVDYSTPKPTSRITWLGNQPKIEFLTKSKKGNHWEMAELTFQTNRENFQIRVDKEQGKWLARMLEELSIHQKKNMTRQLVMTDYEQAGLENFELFWDNKPVNTLYKAGLLSF